MSVKCKIYSYEPGIIQIEQYKNDILIESRKFTSQFKAIANEILGAINIVSSNSLDYLSEPVNPEEILINDESFSSVSDVITALKGISNFNMGGGPSENNPDIEVDGITIELNDGTLQVVDGIFIHWGENEKSGNGGTLTLNPDPTNVETPFLMRCQSEYGDFRVGISNYNDIELVSQYLNLIGQIFVSPNSINTSVHLDEDYNFVAFTMNEEGARTYVGGQESIITFFNEQSNMPHTEIIGSAFIGINGSAILVNNDNSEIIIGDIENLHVGINNRLLYLAKNSYDDPAVLIGGDDIRLSSTESYTGLYGDTDRVFLHINGKAGITLYGNQKDDPDPTISTIIGAEGNIKSEVAFLLRVTNQTFRNMPVFIYDEESMDYVEDHIAYISDLNEILPAPPTEGTYQLIVQNGVMSWQQII